MPYVRIGQRKVLNRRKRSRSAPAVLITPAKRAKRKQWTESQMKAAIEAVRSGESGINRAAVDHGIPSTTLKNRISGRVKKDSTGPDRYLTDSEEKELSTFLKSCASLGYGKTRRDVMNIAETYAKRKRLLRKDKISQGWWREFIKRQGDLSLRRGDNTAHVRMDAINSDTIMHYFDLLESTLKENGLMNSPSQIYNVDESGMPLDPKAPSIIAKTGTKKVRYRATGKKGQITIVTCASASGQIMPPTIIFEAKQLNHAWTSGELPGTTYGCSDKGWITKELFESWLSEHFLKHAVSARPLLLLLDGHSTHNQPDVIRYAMEKKIIILCLPPHTTHEAQPLDCGVFSPLKAQWKNVAHHFLQSNPGKVITKFNFNTLFAKAWINAVTPVNAIAGFKTCGIYPFNPSAITVQESESSSSKSGENSVCGNTEFCTTVSDDIEDNAVEVALTPASFSAEQEALFATRYEEGYDVYTDKDYITWIKLNHPELNINLLVENSSTSINPVTSNNLPGPSEQPTSSNTVTASTDPITPGDDLNTNCPVSGDQPTSVSFVPSITSQVSPCHNSSSNETTPTNVVDTSVSVILGSGSDPSTSPLSDLLVCPALTTPSTSKRPPSYARLLTSHESLALLEEKENKKKTEVMEKEKRKKERAEKKKEREEEMRRKKEEKAKKAEEKANKAKEKAKKTETITRKTKASGKKNSSMMQPTAELCPLVYVEPSSEITTSSHSDQAGPSNEITTSSSSDRHDDSINVNICCMCFVHYEDDVLEGLGADWISCKCGRWLHEDCVEDVIKDNDDDERYCSFCIDKFTI